MAVIDDPAAAVAAGLCLTARAVDRDARTTRHPRRCGWCDYPTHELQRMVDGWNEWAAPNERRGTYGRHEARAFQGLSRTEQLRQVLAAQAFDPEPMPAVSPPQADDQEEDVPWL